MLVNELKRIIKVFTSSSPVAVINFDTKSAVISVGQIFIKFNIATEDSDKRGVMFSCSDIKLSALKGAKSVSFSSDGDTWGLYNNETGDELLSGTCPELPSPIPVCEESPRKVSTVTISEMQSLLAPKVKTSFPVFIYGQKNALAAMYMDPMCCLLYKVDTGGQTSPFSIGLDKKVMEMAVKAASAINGDNWDISLFKCWDMPFISIDSNGFSILAPCVPKKAPSAINFFKGAAAPKINIKIPLDIEGERICINTYNGSIISATEDNASEGDNHIVAVKAINAIPFIDHDSELGVSSSEGYIFINCKDSNSTLKCAVIGQY